MCPRSRRVVFLSPVVLVRLFDKANGKCDSREALPISSFIKWHPPDRHDVIKLNFDGSISNNRAATTFVLCNSNSQVIRVGALNLDGAIILVAEATGLREGLQCARRKGFTKVKVEGDSKLIIDAVQGHWGIPWRVSSIINDIRILARSFSHVDWKHIFREINFVADALAHLILSLSNPHYWDFCLPDVATPAFNFDCIGNGCTRGFML
ncbi:uncharacterized protein LOC103929570 [Pyrus x bretschneideri]|uniref:uncharacterized protein LOC103929570 n=1 Tax=Pyrus x bretschneideri TaxID=225117 RepID=UPI002030F30D|nr:uncharacterized protein LOC103929570 [Pyrus x bretschneideri]